MLVKNLEREGGAAMVEATGHGSRRRSGAHVVSDVLRERIVSGQLEPGVRLFEPELARTLNVSRTPVREALRTLTAEGLLSQLPTGGVAVAALDVDQLEDVYQVRAALEGLIARQACERMTPQALQELHCLGWRHKSSLFYSLAG